MLTLIASALDYPIIGLVSVWLAADPSGAAPWNYFTKGFNTIEECEVARVSILEQMKDEENFRIEGVCLRREDLGEAIKKDLMED